jgi:hypothetical protein
MNVRIFAGGGGCTNFWWGWGGGREGPAIFSALACRGGAARTKIASWSWSCWSAARGGLPGHRRSALGGRINELKGQQGEEAGMPLGVVAGRAWCYV